MVLWHNNLFFAYPEHIYCMFWTGHKQPACGGQAMSEATKRSVIELGPSSSWATMTRGEQLAETLPVIAVADIPRPDCRNCPDARSPDPCLGLEQVGICPRIEGK